MKKNDITEAPKRVLIGALGAAIATGAAAAPVIADETSVSTMGLGSNGTTLSVEGGLSFSNFTQNHFDGDFGGKLEDEGYPVDSANGYYGSISLGRSLNSGWDFSLSASALGGLENADSFVEEGPYDESDLFSYSSQLKASIFDFDLGKTTHSNGFSSRLGFGVSYQKISQNLDKGVYDEPGEDFDIVKTGFRFQGIGPKVSLQLENRLGDSSGFSLIGEVEGAYLFGRSTGTMEKMGEYEGVPESFGPVSLQENFNVLSGSLMVGLAYDASDTTRLKVGVRSHVFKGIGIGGDQPWGPLSNPVVTNTAFVGVEMKF